VFGFSDSSTLKLFLAPLANTAVGQWTGTKLQLNRCRPRDGGAREGESLSVLRE
jgi:hypothetical protein